MQDAEACTCAEIEVAEAFDLADAVFTGDVATVGDDPDDGSDLRVAFEVSRRFKGADVASIAIFTSGSSAACGFLFEAGESYLVYAAESGGSLFASACSRTRPLASAEDEIVALDALIDGEPLPGSNGESPDDSMDDEGGCAASSGSTGGAALWFLVLALCLVRRSPRARRRSALAIRCSR